jgi:2-phospho-L-lactate guanylyltransferase
MIIALIPVKELSQAKARLAPVLDEGARRELALAIFRDVLAAALACHSLDRVAAVTRDEAALALASEAGAEGLAEAGGLNEALTSAARQAAERGATRVVVLAADLALANAEGIAAAVAADADVVVVPSTDGGTNALVLAPAAIAFAYGPDSARRHMDAAQRAGLRALRLELAALALDIDTPADLERLRAEAEAGRAGAHTRAALERLGLIAPVVRGG